MQKKSENSFLRYRARSSRWAFVIATGTKKIDQQKRVVVGCWLVVGSCWLLVDSC
jgi:hypothetical protein